MTISFKCPNCEASLHAPDDYAGGKAKCKSCGTPIHIPKGRTHESATDSSTQSVVQKGQLRPRQTGGAHVHENLGDRRDSRANEQLVNELAPDRLIPARSSTSAPKYIAIGIVGLILLTAGIIAVIVRPRPSQDETAITTPAVIATGTKLPEAPVDILVYPDFEADLFGLMKRDGTIVVEPIFHHVPRLSEGLAAVQAEWQDGLYGYIDKHGEWKIPPRLSTVNNEPPLDSDYEFSEGLVCYYSKRQQAYGFINTVGEPVIEPRFAWPSKFSEGLAYVVGLRQDGSEFEGFIDRNGNSPFNMPPGGYLHPVGEDGFSEGLVAFRRKDKMGYLDRTGRVVVLPRFREASAFHGGLAAACVDEHWGYIDRSGEFVIQPAFEAADDFSEGLAAVAVIDGGCGYIDKTGAFVVEPVYAEARPFSGGLACVQKDDKLGTYGFVNARGEEVVSAVCEVAWPLEDGLGGCWPFGYFDDSGTLVLRAKGFEGLHPDSLKPSYWEAGQNRKSQNGP